MTLSTVALACTFHDVGQCHGQLVVQFKILHLRRAVCRSTLRLLSRCRDSHHLPSLVLRINVPQPCSDLARKPCVRLTARPALRIQLLYVLKSQTVSRCIAPCSDRVPRFWVTVCQGNKREREKEREKERKRETEGKRERGQEGQRERGKERKRERVKERKSERERERQRRFNEEVQQCFMME